MRTQPLIGRKAWFGPRRKGHGLTPVTAEGWAVVIVGSVGEIATFIIMWPVPWPAFVIAAAMVAVLLLKGTSPGGPAEWLEYRDARDRDSAL